MKLTLLLLLSLAALPLLADEHPVIQPSADDVQLGTIRALNNVFAVTEGRQMALCGCGKEFEVTEASPKLDHDGVTFYLCGPECLDHATKVTPEESAVETANWEKAFYAKDMMSNTEMADGKKTATCACGQTFEVSSKSPYLIENGMKMCACCDGCASHVAKAAPEERGAMMRKVMKTAAMTK